MLKKLMLSVVVGMSTLLAGMVAGQAADPIKIGLLQPTKSVLGKKAVVAAEVAADMVNEAGGVLGGRQIELVVYDDNFSPVDGVAAAQRLLTQDGARILAGNISSSVAIAIIPVIENEDGLYMATVPKHTDVTKSGYDKVFRLNSTSVMDAKVFNDFIVNELKPQKIAFIGENNDFGRQVVQVLKDLSSGQGSDVVYEGLYEAKQSDFNSLVVDAKASGADTLFIAGANVEQYSNVARSATEMGFAPKNLVTAAGTLNSDFVRLAGESAKGAVSVDIYIPGMKNDLNAEFTKRFEAAYGALPEKVEELNFEAIWILAHAIEKAGTADDLSAVAEVIRSNSWDTPRGDVTFDSEGQAQGKTFVITVKDGQIVAR
jgi:branched-chain amino acid transport system substrate-binding protein